MKGVHSVSVNARQAVLLPDFIFDEYRIAVRIEMTETIVRHHRPRPEFKINLFAFCTFSPKSDAKIGDRHKSIF